MSSAIGMLEESDPGAGPSDSPTITATRAIRLSSFSFSKDFAHSHQSFGCWTGSQQRPVTIHQSDPVSSRCTEGRQLAAVPESSTGSLLRSRKWFLSGENLSCSSRDDQEVRRSSAVVVPSAQYAEWSSGDEHEGADERRCGADNADRRRLSMRKVSHWQRNAPSLRDQCCKLQRQSSPTSKTSSQFGKPAKGISVTITSDSRADSSSSLISLASISSSGSSGMGSAGDHGSSGSSARSSNPLSSSSCSSGEDRKESEEEGIYSPPPPSNTPISLLSLELAAEHFGQTGGKSDSNRRRIPPLSQGYTDLPPTSIPPPLPLLFPWPMPIPLGQDIALRPSYPILPAAQLANHALDQHIFASSAVPHYPAALVVPNHQFQLPPPSFSLLGAYTALPLVTIHATQPRTPWLMHPFDPFGHRQQCAASVTGLANGLTIGHGPPHGNITAAASHRNSRDIVPPHTPAAMEGESRSSEKKQDHAQAGPSTGLNRTQVPPARPWLEDAIISMSTQMMDFTHKGEQTKGTLKNKHKVRDLLFDYLRAADEKCGLFIVGSSLNGFGTNDSDMDLCLMITGRDIDQRSDAVRALTVAERVLANVDFVAKQVLIQAKVPILRIRLKGHYAGITVDLNVNNAVAIRNTHLLFYYSIFDECRRVKPLVAVVKEWARRKGINDASTSSLTSYSLVLMVIHYLQYGVYPPILPSLQHLCPYRFDGSQHVRQLDISHCFRDANVDRWIRNTCQNQMNIAQLLLGFFEYYAYKFDFETDVISVRLGCKINRMDVAANRSPYNQLNQWQWICIEEPFTLSNTAHAVYDARVFSEIKNAFVTGLQDLWTTVSTGGDFYAWLENLRSAPR